MVHGFNSVRVKDKIRSVDLLRQIIRLDIFHCVLLGDVKIMLLFFTRFSFYKIILYFFFFFN